MSSRFVKLFKLIVGCGLEPSTNENTYTCIICMKEISDNLRQDLGCSHIICKDCYYIAYMHGQTTCPFRCGSPLDPEGVLPFIGNHLNENISSLVPPDGFLPDGSGENDTNLREYFSNSMRAIRINHTDGSSEIFHPGRSREIFHPDGSGSSEIFHPNGIREFVHTDGSREIFSPTKRRGNRGGRNKKRPHDPDVKPGRKCGPNSVSRRNLL